MSGAPPLSTLSTTSVATLRHKSRSAADSPAPAALITAAAVAAAIWLALNSKASLVSASDAAVPSSSFVPLRNAARLINPSGWHRHAPNAPLSGFMPWPGGQQGAIADETADEHVPGGL